MFLKKYKKTVENDKSHVLLVNPSDMGNLGTIIRTMGAFNFNNLVMIRPAVDIFDPRVVRSSMGSFFGLNFEYIDSYMQYEERFEKHIKYPFVLEGRKILGEFTFNKPATLIFGNEGSGLSEQYKRMIETVKIKHSGGVDSLNLAVAASLAMYEFSKA